MNTLNHPEVPANQPFNSYFVTVDLSRVGHNMRPIEDCLSRFPDVLQVHANAWIVTTLSNGEELFATLQAAIPDGGRLWMSDTSSACGWIAGDYRTNLQIRQRIAK